MAHNNGMVISTPPIAPTSAPTSPINPNYTLVTSSNTAYNASDAVNISAAAIAKAGNNSNNNTTSSIASLLLQGDNLHPSQHPNHKPTLIHKNGYVSRVGFDTLGCNDTAEYAFTLQAKSDGWKRSKKSRTFLVGTDLNEYSAHALSWTMENMVEDGDEVSINTLVGIILLCVCTNTNTLAFVPKRDLRSL